jgi:hypothetical protein
MYRVIAVIFAVAAVVFAARLAWTVHCGAPGVIRAAGSAGWLVLAAVAARKAVR